MTLLLRSALALCVLNLALVAQQTGDMNRDYTINTNGAGGTSPVLNLVGVSGQTMDNSYATQDALAPVLWAVATGTTTNWLPGLSANSVDIGPGGLSFLLDGTFGTSSSFINFFAVTNSTGTFDLNVPVNGALAGSTYFFAMAHISAASPDGFYVSQTHSVSFVLDPSLGAGTPTPTPGGVPIVLGDDATTTMALGFSFMYYGVAYSNVEINSNGHITFGSGLTGWAGGNGGFASLATPMIATLSEDLNPSQGGTISFFTDNVGFFEVGFQNVPSYFNTGPNTFLTSCFNGIAIQMDYGALAEAEGLVGLSPGVAAGATEVVLNLSVGPHAIGPNTAPYEDFTPFPIGGGPALVNDLAGLQLLWFTDASGNPISVQ